jgi:amino acid adenylation domain-containing protein
MRITAPSAENLFTLFARQAASRPDEVAIVGHAASTSYGALAARARAIATALEERGLDAEQPIGVLMRRTPDLVATLLGILKAGACYVPLDPDDPVALLGSIVESAGCPLVVGHEDLLSGLSSSMEDARDGSRLPSFIDVETLRPSGVGPSDRPDASGGARLAYVLFTSGTTGAPKGVEVEHRSVVNLLLGARELLGFTSADRCLATSTIAFDVSIAEIFLPLIAGGAVVLRDRHLLLEPHRLVDEIRRHHVTVFQTGPAVWGVVLAEGPEFPRLRVAISTGEAIRPDLARRLAGAADTAWNLYGPTETTVWAAGHRLGATESTDEPRSTISAPIGKPLSNIEVRVLDEQRMPVGVGVRGELWIGGVALARGYRGRDMLTRERFVAIGEDGQRFYRTGDVVAVDRDGTIHYFGRNDDQIKVRGVRIEPMEVESALASHPGVSHAAATWFETVPGSRAVAAAVVVRPGFRVTRDEIHEQASRLLPAAMVPARYVFCDALPLSPSGKVDRGVVRALAVAASGSSTTDVQSDALTDTERTLIDIWQRTLGVHPVKRQDHFFTIGGDSLSAVTMILEIEAAFDVSLSVRTVFEAPALDKLAARVDHLQAQAEARMKAPLQAEDLSNQAFVFPLSASGGGTPVFFHNINFRMARKGLWSLDCPLYAVSQWAQGTGFTKAESVEDLARVHLEGIRSVQPRGPYRLAGYSFGGLVALEMAHQLRRAGETVELLFLLDPSEPDTDGYRLRYPKPGVAASRPPEGLRARASWRLQRLADDPGAIPAYARSLTRRLPGGVLRAVDRHTRRPAWEWLSYQLVHFYGRHPSPVSARLVPRNRWPAFWHHTRRLSRAYVPQPYDGDTLAMFISHQERQAMWRTLLGPRADVRVFDSSHLGMFAEPALSLWLEPLGERLGRRP